MFYRNWEIIYEPPSISDRRHDFCAIHRDYDGPEDGRYFTAGSIQEAKDLVDEYEEDNDPS